MVGAPPPCDGNYGIRTAKASTGRVEAFKKNWLELRLLRLWSETGRIRTTAESAYRCGKHRGDRFDYVFFQEPFYGYKTGKQWSLEPSTSPFGGERQSINSSRLWRSISPCFQQWPVQSGRGHSPKAFSVSILRGSRKREACLRFRNLYGIGLSTPRRSEVA